MHPLLQVTATSVNVLQLQAELHLCSHCTLGILCCKQP